MNKIKAKIYLLIPIFILGINSIGSGQENQPKSRQVQATDFDCVDIGCTNINFTVQGKFVYDFPGIKRDDGTLVEGYDFVLINGAQVISQPVVFVSGNVPKIDLTVVANCPSLPEFIRVRGVPDAGSTDFGFNSGLATEINNEPGLNQGTFNYSNIAQSVFPMHEVNYLPYTIDWQVSFDGGENWESMGVSVIRTYVTWEEPMAENPGNDARQGNGFEYLESVFYLACHDAVGVTEKTEIINRSWDVFNTGDIATVDGQPLHFYNSWNSETYASSNLIQEKDGQCYAWVGLFFDLLKAQGIEDEKQLRYIFSTHDYPTSPTTVASAIALINDWTFNTAPSLLIPNPAPFLVQQGFNYVNVQHPNFETDLNNSNYNFTFAEVQDENGVPGQNIDNPLSNFGIHALAKINGYYYDPSYENRAPMLDDANFIYDYEEANMAGYYHAFMLGINEQSIQQDLDGDGVIVDDEVEVMVWFIKTNSSNVSEMEIGDNIITY